MRDYKTQDDLRGIRRAYVEPSKAELAKSVLALVFMVVSFVLLFLLGAGLTAADAHAQESRASKLWVTPGAVSYHLNRDKGYNEVNYGIGLEYRAGTDFSLALGQYKNSIGRTSHYALVGYTPWHPASNVRVGALVGVVDGYQVHGGQIMPALIPVVAIEFRHVGVNISVVPPFRDKVDGALAVQFKFRF